MAIVVKHGKPETIISAAKRAGEAQAAIREQEQAERLQAQQMEFDYRTALRQQDMAIDLQMNERAKLWEIEKMELRSRMDFEREEQKRQRKIDDAENAIRQLKKEIEAGKFDEDDLQIKNLLLYYELQAQNPDRMPPTSLLKPPFTKKESALDIIMQQYLGEGDVGEMGLVKPGRIRVVSPTGQKGTIEASEIEVFKAKGFTIIGEGAPTKEPITKKVRPKLKPYGSVYREWL